MERIKIEDLPKEMKVSREEMGRIYGGFADKDPVVLGKSGGTAQDEIDAYAAGGHLKDPLDEAIEKKFFEVRMKMA